MLMMMGKLRIESSVSNNYCTVQILNLKMRKRCNNLLSLIVWTRVTRSISVVSLMSNVPTAIMMKDMVPHTLTPMKASCEWSMPTPLIHSLK